MPHKHSDEVVLAYDLGGTKVSVGAVDSRGRVLREVRVPVDLELGKPAVIRQLVELGKGIRKEFPQIKRAGIASAGPLDPIRGTLLDPANFVDKGGKTWGNVPLAKLLAEKLRIPVTLENDAAAAMLAEHWVGAARGYDNAMILTLGTGVGTGFIAGGKLVRAGRDLHPEGGHIIIGHDDPTAVCGCGNLGCAEAYLSGNGFARRARLKFDDPKITAKDVADRARNGDRAARAMFDEYAKLLASALRNYIVLYCPEVVVLTGSFAAASDLFLDQTYAYLEKLMVRRRKGVDLMPRIALSMLENQAGLIGGGIVAFQASHSATRLTVKKNARSARTPSRAGSARKARKSLRTSTRRN